jgi:hypothetical protein
MAGRCLGELVRKAGDRVLVQMVPILQVGRSLRCLSICRWGTSMLRAPYVAWMLA